MSRNRPYETTLTEAHSEEMTNKFCQRTLPRFRVRANMELRVVMTHGSARICPIRSQKEKFYQQN